jgi:hypothetical protein
MVDSNNLQASAGIRVSAVILILVSIMNISKMMKSFRNLKYKEAQFLLSSIYLMPITIGWISWVQLMNTSELRSIQFTLTVLKAVCLASFLAYVERMIGWTVVDGQNLYSKERLYLNLVTQRAPKCILPCIKIRVIDSEETARWYIERIRSFVYQLCAVLTTCTFIGFIYIIAADDPKVHKGRGTKLFLILSGCTSFSSLVALSAMFNFGVYANSLPVLSTLKVLHKFMIIKLGLLFTEFQPLVIAIFTYSGLIANTDKFSPEEITLYTNSLLVVSEMIIMSFLIVEVFPLSDYDSSPELRKSLALLNDEIRE